MIPYGPLVWDLVLLSGVLAFVLGATDAIPERYAYTWTGIVFVLALSVVSG